MPPVQPPNPAAAGARSAWLAPVLVFALTLFVTGLLLASVARSIQAKDQAAFESEVGRTTDAVRERLDTVVTLLRGATGLFAGSTEVTRAEFRAYVAALRLRDRYPGVLGIGYSERIPAERLASRVAQLRAAGVPDLHVWPEGPRDEYHAIVYIEPFDRRNAAAVGFDMFTEPTRREAMARARDDGQAAASGKVTLVQEIDEDKQAGLLVYLPMYHGGVPDTPQRRRAALQGFVYAPLRTGDLLAGVQGSGPAMVDYELYDGGVAHPAALLRSTRAGAAGRPKFSDERRLEVAGRIWLLRFSSRPAFEDLSQWWLVPWLAAASLLAAGLLAWITRVQARARREAEAAAAQRRSNELALRGSEERERERAQRLQQLYAELRDGEQRKDEFLAVLAHELRNPLAPLRTSLEILRRRPDTPAAQRARAIAERQVAHMVRLIDDLLDVSRISRGKITLQRRRTPLAEVLDAAVETSLPLIEARGHELVRQPVDPAIALDIDPARVAQIFTNLLNNAAHYTPEGGRIELAVEAGREEVRVAVRDNGIGIEAEKLRQVFELFVQADRSPAGGGLGIGLSLAARLAEMHGGHIEASSAGKGRGALFVVVLPRPGEPPSAGAAAGAPQELAGELPGTQLPT